MSQHSHLSDQTGKHENARKKVGHLKGDLKDGVGLVETTDVDQTADSVVITTQVPAEEGDFETDIKLYRTGLFH